MTSSEFSPYNDFKRLLSLWWLIALAAILGGAFGYVFYQLHHPVYEAKATFLVTIDLEHFPFQGLQDDVILYNEDLAMNTTQSVLLSDEVLSQVINQAQSTGISINPNGLLSNYTIERKQELWELRYRSQVAKDAQVIVNIWATVGYQAMVDWQATGKVPNFVIFHAPTMAPIPQEPSYYDRNKVILAGVLIGLIAGILLSGPIARNPKISAENP